MTRSDNRWCSQDFWVFIALPKWWKAMLRIIAVHSCTAIILGQVAHCLHFCPWRAPTLAGADKALERSMLSSSDKKQCSASSKRFAHSNYARLSSVLLHIVHNASRGQLLMLPWYSGNHWFIRVMIVWAVPHSSKGTYCMGSCHWVQGASQTLAKWSASNNAFRTVPAKQSRFGAKHQEPIDVRLLDAFPRPVLPWVLLTEYKEQPRLLQNAQQGRSSSEVLRCVPEMKSDRH